MVAVRSDGHMNEPDFGIHQIAELARWRVERNQIFGIPIVAATSRHQYKCAEELTISRLYEIRGTSVGRRLSLIQTNSSQTAMAISPVASPIHRPRMFIPWTKQSQRPMGSPSK